MLGAQKAMSAFTPLHAVHPDGGLVAMTVCTIQRIMKPVVRPLEGIATATAEDGSDGVRVCPANDLALDLRSVEMHESGCSLFQACCSFELLPARYAQVLGLMRVALGQPKGSCVHRQILVVAATDHHNAAPSCRG